MRKRDRAVFRELSQVLSVRLQDPSTPVCPKSLIIRQLEPIESGVESCSSQFVHVVSSTVKDREMMAEQLGLDKGIEKDDEIVDEEKLMDVIKRGVGDDHLFHDPIGSSIS